MDEPAPTDPAPRTASRRTWRLLALALWALAWGSAALLGRTGGVALAVLGVLTLASLALPRALGLALPVLALLALTCEYALHPAEASALFSIGLLGAAQLAALVWVRAVWWAGGLAGGGLVGRLLLVTTALTGTFLAGELAAQRVWPRVPHGIVATEGSPAPAPYVPDAELQHVHAPGFTGAFVHPEYDRETIAINSDGFRGAPWPDAPPAAGELRVLLLGDSTTVGFGVREEETIAARLEELLRARGARATVLNGGVAGYSPCHAEIVLARTIARARPTHVVCLFYDGNDLDDCRARFEHARAASPTHGGGAELATEATAAPQRRASGTLLGRTYWHRYSALYRRLEPAVLPFVARAGLVEPDHAYASMLRVTRVPPPADVAEELDLAAAAVRGLAARCAEASASFLLARLPARVQTEPASFADLVRRYGADPKEHERANPGALLLARAAADGIETLDLLQRLEVEGHGPNPRYFLEGHPNREGDRTIAEALAGAIE